MPSERDAVLDRMMEFAMEELLSGDPERTRALVRAMAQRWPDEPALALAFALTSATQAIEAIFAEAGGRAAIPLGYRISALVSADIHAVQSMGQVPAMAEDLLHFWRRVDPAFLSAV